MRKLIALLTAIILMVSFSGAVYAVPVHTQKPIRAYYNSEYGFVVTERDGESNTLVRSCERSLNASSAARSVAAYNVNAEQNSEAGTKALLSALGMGDEFIAKLSEEDLRGYAVSERIVSTVSYIKSDEDGNVTSVTEEEAESAAELYGLILPPHVKDDDTPGGGGDGATYTDSYMKIVFIISYWGQGRYKFSVDATWLTAPAFRLTDSLGACAQNFTVENNTRSGWYSYTATVHTGESLIEYDGETALSDFVNATNGNWYGSAVRVDLMDDVNGGDGSGMSTYVHYTNHMIHYEYFGTIHHSTLETSFNTTATYDHVTAVIVPDFSIDIFTANVSAGIGFNSFTMINEPRLVELDHSIHYVPD